MGPKMKRITDASRGKIAFLEHRLSSALRPIEPRKEFVHGIAQRIRTKSRVAFVDRIASWHLIAILIAGLVSLTVFMAVLGRALMTLVDKKRTART